MVSYLKSQIFDIKLKNSAIEWKSRNITILFEIIKQLDVFLEACGSICELEIDLLLKCKRFSSFLSWKRKRIYKIRHNTWILKSNKQPTTRCSLPKGGKKRVTLTCPYDWFCGKKCVTLACVHDWFWQKKM